MAPAVLDEENRALGAAHLSPVESVLGGSAAEAPVWCAYGEAGFGAGRDQAGPHLAQGAIELATIVWSNCRQRRYCVR